MLTDASVRLARTAATKDVPYWRGMGVLDEIVLRLEGLGTLEAIDMRRGYFGARDRVGRSQV